MNKPAKLLRRKLKLAAIILRVTNVAIKIIYKLSFLYNRAMYHNFNKKKDLILIKSKLNYDKNDLFLGRVMFYLLLLPTTELFYLMKIQKTNAIRLLDKESIVYEVVQYEVDESDLSAIHVAEQLHEAIEQVFKTLVLKGDKTGYFVCIIPGAEELNLKMAAKISENKNCQLILMKDLLSITGYIRGACSPIGMKKKFSTYIHSSCEDFDFIYISAGQRGLQIKISPFDLIKMVDIKVCELF